MTPGERYAILATAAKAWRRARADAKDPKARTLLISRIRREFEAEEELLQALAACEGEGAAPAACTEEAR